MSGVMKRIQNFKAKRKQINIKTVLILKWLHRYLKPLLSKVSKVLKKRFI